MSTNVLVIAESRDGAIKGISREAVTCAVDLAGQLGGEVHSLLVGDSGLADELAAAGGNKVFTASGAGLDQYTPETWVAAATQVIAAGDYGVVLTGHSYQAIDFFPRLAAAHDAADSARDARHTHRTAPGGGIGAAGLPVAPRHGDHEVHDREEPADYRQGSQPVHDGDPRRARRTHPQRRHRRDVPP